MKTGYERKFITGIAYIDLSAAYVSYVASTTDCLGRRPMNLQMTRSLQE